MFICNKIQYYLCIESVRGEVLIRSFLQMKWLTLPQYGDSAYVSSPFIAVGMMIRSCVDALG